MKRIVIMAALFVSVAMMIVSCRFGAAYLNCVSSCENKADYLFGVCSPSYTSSCILAVNVYIENCKKACE